ncbi:virulence RhuM family protein [Candidatus Dojkabacteria bacterium]|uniref:Virulence RhuM family protein n=1 Tax=Candidatus Dojkabacteria bacterium TaxID=2099670 RepID=A0A955RKF7_9BACT|nr:virulence RhuM family protein [Candidatus Dojkabacteria bacterium]
MINHPKLKTISNHDIRVAFSIDQETLENALSLLHSDTKDSYDFSTFLALSFIIDTEEARKIKEWASESLESYIGKGYIIDKDALQTTQQERLSELHEVISLMRDNVDNKVFEGKEQDLFSLIEDYAHTWDVFHRFDKDQLLVEEVHTNARYSLSYDDAQHVIKELRSVLVKKDIATDVFGYGGDQGLHAIIGIIGQSFGGHEVYPSIEEKAAHILYLIIKDHPFVDGNKRIASALFIYFLEKNNFSWNVNKQKKINDNALVALALLVATSEPRDKETMIQLIIRLLQNDFNG